SAVLLGPCSRLYPLTYTTSAGPASTSASRSAVNPASAPLPVTKVRSPESSTRATHTPVSLSSLGGHAAVTPSSRNAARTRSPNGPEPCAPAYTTRAPDRAAAAITLNPPPGSNVVSEANTSPPGSGNASTRMTRSRMTLPVWTSLPVTARPPSWAGLRVHHRAPYTTHRPRRTRRSSPSRYAPANCRPTHRRTTPRPAARRR